MTPRIKNKSPKKERFHVQEPPNYDNRPPLFSLEKVQSGKYGFKSLDTKNKAMFAEAMFRRRSLPWSHLQKQHRHKLGTEKISKFSITAAIPSSISEDLNGFLAFRYNGKRPMVGYREKNVFFVLWFDHDFTLYPH